MFRFRISWSHPKSAKIALLYSFGSDLLQQYVPSQATSIIDPQNPNLFAFIRMLSTGRKSFFDYTVAYLKLYKPDFVLTFIDNNVDFYKFSRLFPDIKFIAIQNGLRANYANQPGFGFFDLLEKESTKHDLSAHAICVFGKSFGDLFERFVKTDSIVTGSLKNNLIGDKIAPTAHFDIVYVSQHAPFEIPNSDVKFFFGNKVVDASDFYAIEQKIVRFLSERSVRTHQTFAVLGKRTNSSRFERDYFVAAVNPIPLNFIPRTSEISTYEFCNSASLIVTADSALGYEFLARGKRVAFLSGRINAFSDVLSREIHDTEFGFPLELGSTGVFWTNTADELEFERVIESLQTISDEQWASAISPYNDVLMAYQPDNSAFVQMLRNEGIPISNEGSQRA